MTTTIITHATGSIIQPRLASLAQTCRRAAAAGVAGWLMLGCSAQQAADSSAAGGQSSTSEAGASQSGGGSAAGRSSAQPTGPLAEPGQQANTLNAAERGAGWRLLFDGTSMNGWRAYQGDTMPPAWHVMNGSIMKNVPTTDIVTREQFANFELTFDWKLGRGGNAGAFYRATEEYERVYWSAPEYQLLDDPNAPDGRNRLTSAGAAYGLYPAPEGVVKPAGEWNAARIIVNGAHVEHWLNGRKLLEYEFWSPDWLAKVQASKFKDWPNYGRATRGHIALQGDHSGDLELRNIKIRELR